MKITTIAIVMASASLLSFQASARTMLSLDDAIECADRSLNFKSEERSIDKYEDKLSSLDRDIDSLESALGWAEVNVNLAESTYTSCWDNCWSVESAYDTALNDYNRKVDQINRIIGQREDVYNDYEYALDSFNYEVDDYNADCVNVSVKTVLLNSDELCGNDYSGSPFCKSFD